MRSQPRPCLIQSEIEREILDSVKHQATITYNRGDCNSLAMTMWV
jgi:hypothetical protein